MPASHDQDTLAVDGYHGSTLPPRQAFHGETFPRRAHEHVYELDGVDLSHAVEACKHVEEMLQRAARVSLARIVKIGGWAPAIQLYAVLEHGFVPGREPVGLQASSDPELLVFELRQRELLSLLVDCGKLLLLDLCDIFLKCVLGDPKVAERNTQQVLADLHAFRLTEAE